MPGPSLDPKRLEALFAEVAGLVAVDPLCAAQVAVARDGELLAYRAFGRARFGQAPQLVERDATPESLFPVFSVTKAIVASASWILLQEGALDLSDRVVDWIPEFGTHGKEVVTLEQLLTHTCGFPNAPFETEDWRDPGRRLARFAQWRLEWEPGSRFVYHGNSAMWVLAELVTRRSGLDYREFIRRRISGPLGLRDLHIGLPTSERDRVAELIAVGRPPPDARRRGSPVDAPPIDEAELPRFNSPSWREIGSPSGGAITTAADVALFYQGLLADAAGRGPGIWQASQLEDAWRPRNSDLVDPMTRQRAYRGLGVVVAGERERMWRGFAEACSARSFGHMGLGGQIAWADPESGLSFAFCTNGAQRDPLRQGARGLRLSMLAAACAE
jgi:CubicO group peptidase (beta-lactamase class C family)